MIKIIISIVIAYFCYGCTHIVTRTGYKFDNNKSQEQNCDPKILKNAPFDSTKCELLGKVKVGESGFSVVCGEDAALKIFKKEACNVGADEINIIEEKRPDIWSSCYRATALLIKSGINNVEPIVSNDMDKKQNYEIDTLGVKNRVSEDNQRNTMYVLLGLLSGILAGLLTFGLSN